MFISVLYFIVKIVVLVGLSIYLLVALTNTRQGVIQFLVRNVLQSFIKC
jgi:hypothetical protein